MNRHRSTISRELRRNRGQRGYWPKQAHEFSQSACGTGRTAPEFLKKPGASSTSGWANLWSPEQIGGRLAAQGQGSSDPIFPKKMRFQSIAKKDIAFATRGLNHCPRKCLAFKTPTRYTCSSYTRATTLVHSKLESAFPYNGLGQSRPDPVSIKLDRRRRRERPDHPHIRVSWLCHWRSESGRRSRRSRRRRRP